MLKRGWKLLVQWLVLREEDIPLLGFPFHQESQSSVAPQANKLCVFCCICFLLSLGRASGAGKSSIAGLGFARVLKSHLKVLFIGMKENKG